MLHQTQWTGDAQVQIGVYDDPPPPQLRPFLAGFVQALTAHTAVREAHIQEVNAFQLQPANPTRHITFRFEAASQRAAERLASDELRDAGLRGGINALETSQREFGWTIAVRVSST